MVGPPTVELITGCTAGTGGWAWVMVPLVSAGAGASGTKTLGLCGCDLPPPQPAKGATKAKARAQKTAGNVRIRMAPLSQSAQSQVFGAPRVPRWLLGFRPGGAPLT